MANVYYDTTSSPLTSTTGSYIISSANYNGVWGAVGSTSITASTSHPSLKVVGDAEFESDIKWQGRSLGTMLESIEKRLAILTPDPAKLEHFEALQKAYEHYKVLEALCEIPKQTKE